MANSHARHCPVKERSAVALPPREGWDFTDLNENFVFMLFMFTKRGTCKQPAIIAHNILTIA